MKTLFPTMQFAKLTTASIVKNARYLILLGLFAGCSQASEQELLNRAQIAIELGNTRAAEIDTRAALQINPNNAAARQLLGEVYLFQQNSQAAVEEFQRSLTAEENEDVRVQYAQALLAANRGDQILTMDAQNEFISVIENPRYITLLAIAQASGGELQNARTSMAEALATAPDDPFVLTNNALFLLIYLNRIEEARAILQEVVQLHPEHLDAWSLLGGIQQVNSEYAEAETSYENVVQVNPYRFSDRLNLVTVRIEQGKIEEATGALQRLLISNPNHPEVNYLQGRMLIEAGENSEAIPVLLKALNVLPDHPGSLYLSAVANIAEGNYATARGQLDRLLTTQRDQVSVHLLLSNLALLMDNPEEAEEIARSLLQDNPMNFEAMQVLATVLNAQDENNSAESIALYQRMIEARPEAVDVRLALVTALLRSGDVEGSLAQVLAARELAPESILVRESLIQVHLARADLPSAKAEAMAYAELHPQNPSPSLYLARIALTENDTPGANAHYSEAETLLRQAIADQPENLALQGVLIDTLVNQRKLDEAGILLESLPNELANNPEVLVARGRIALAGNRPDEAEPLLRSAMQTSPSNLTLLWLGGTMKAQGRDDDAIELLKDWLANNPADVLVHYELASTYMQVGREQEAREHYFAVVQSVPDNVVALNNLAWLEREDAPQQALNHIEQANELMPNNPGIMDTYAMVQLALGSNDQALSLNQSALDIVPNDPDLRHNRAIILHANGQSDQAIEILQTLTASEGVSSIQKEKAQTLLDELKGV